MSKRIRPKYSICICNRNMADTIENSLKSILEQINSDFEVIVVDDGSSDGSLNVLKNLAKKYVSLRIYSLERDKARKLGYTRNYSIALAEGEWCIFHLDTDDLIKPFILDFVEAVLLLDKSIKVPKLYSGKQIHMARKDFLLSVGPFKNIYRGEDRDLYERLASKNEWVIIKHNRFISRLPRARKKILHKVLVDVLDQTITDLQFNESPIQYFLGSCRSIKSIGSKVFVLRTLLIPFANLVAIKRGKYTSADKVIGEDFVKYREDNTKTLNDWINVFKITDASKILLNSRIFNETNQQI